MSLLHLLYWACWRCFFYASRSFKLCRFTHLSSAMVMEDCHNWIPPICLSQRCGLCQFTFVLGEHLVAGTLTFYALHLGASCLHLAVPKDGQESPVLVCRFNADLYDARSNINYEISSGACTHNDGWVQHAMSTASDLPKD